MKDLILIFPLLGIMAFYYYLLSRLDHFVSTDNALYNADTLSYKDILVYKCEPEILSLFTGNHIQYDLIESFDIPKLCCYKAVLGISDNDLDNLLICKTAKNFNPFVTTVAKCNLNIYRTIFSCKEIDVVVTDINQLQTILKEWEVIK